MLRLLHVKLIVLVRLVVLEAVIQQFAAVQTAKDTNELDVHARAYLHHLVVHLVVLQDLVNGLVVSLLVTDHVIKTSVQPLCLLKLVLSYLDDRVFLVVVNDDDSLYFLLLNYIHARK